MLTTHPKVPLPPIPLPRIRGWPLLLFGLLLAIGVSVPVASPAAVSERSVPPPPTAPDPPPVPPLWMPVAGAVVRGFDARAGPYGPGHRGIDIAAPVGESVRAPASGRVVFAGPVAGTTWVSLLVAPGVVVTLGPLLDPPVTAERVGLRDPVGRVGPGHPLPPVDPRSVGASPIDRGGPGGAGPPTGPAGPGGAGPPVGGGGPGGAGPPVDRGGPGGAGPPAGRVGSGGGATLHLSVRVNGVYADPLAYLVDRPRPRLAPLRTPGGLPGG